VGGHRVVFEYYTPLKRLQEHLQQNPEHPLSLTDAAEVAGLSRTYFSEYFREKTGMTFKQWMDTHRIRRAALLLRKSDSSIKESGRTAGFRDATTFSRTFRRVMKVSPSEYRNSPDEVPKDSEQTP